MLVDNKVPFFWRETAPEISTEFQIFPFAKKQTPTYLHSCFHLKVIVSNRRWIFLLNIFFLPLTFRFLEEGKIWKCIRLFSLRISEGYFARTGHFSSRRCFPIRLAPALILQTENRGRNHDRSKYSTQWSRLARNDI